MGAVGAAMTVYFPGEVRRRVFPGAYDDEPWMPSGFERVRRQSYDLLMSVLTVAERGQFEMSEFVDVPSRLFRGFYRVGTNMRLHVRLPGQHPRSYSLCLVTEKDSIPWFDLVAARVLMAKYDERRLIATARTSRFFPKPDGMFARRRR